MRSILNTEFVQSFFLQLCDELVYIITSHSTAHLEHLVLVDGPKIATTLSGRTAFDFTQPSS